MRVAVVGAGMSGMACARCLQESGVEVAVFDKSRGIGGRTATRRGEGVAFDHGAQYFTAKDPRFVAQVAEWEQHGVVREWGGPIVILRDGESQPAKPSRRLVGVPGMSSMARHLAPSVPVQHVFHVEGIDGDLGLRARDGRRVDGFDRVVLALPAPQVAPLAEALSERVARSARDASFAPCWAVMLAFDARLPVPFDGAFVEDSSLSWVARNSSKPERPAAESWVLHGAPDWSRMHFDAVPADVVASLIEEFRRVTGLPEAPSPRVAQAHRWAYSLPQVPVGGAFVFDAEAGIGACGDWCSEARVEGAFLSGLALARRILQ